MNLIVGLDPGTTAGAYTVIDEDENIIDYRSWKSKNAYVGWPAVATAADFVGMKYPEAKLFYEMPFIKYFVRGGIEEHKIREIVGKLRKGGSVHLPGGYSKTSLDLSECVGAFKARFPLGSDPIPPSEWRKVLGIRGQKGKTDWKQLVIDWSTVYLQGQQQKGKLSPRGSRMLVAIIRGNSHISDSLCVALAGKRRYMKKCELIL